MNNADQIKDTAALEQVQPAASLRLKRVGIRRKVGIKQKTTRTIGGLLLFLLIVSAGVLVWALYKNKLIDNQIKTQNEGVTLPRKKEILDMVKRIERHILLPEGETPSIATIVDIDSLKINPFYANAKNGDKVLIYFQAKKAYIYDPERDLIINMAPVLTENSAASSTNTNSSPAIKVPRSLLRGISPVFTHSLGKANLFAFHSFIS